MIFKKAGELGIEKAYTQGQGCRFFYIHCTAAKKDELMDALGRNTYGCSVVNQKHIDTLKHLFIYHQSYSLADKEKDEKKRKASLDDRLKEAITEYNETYTLMNDHGIQLFNQRVRATDLLETIEYLVNSIANTPKSFEADIKTIHVQQKEFHNVCDFAEKELQAAKESAMGAGAGLAGGVAVASLAPTAAMWVATTFGTASTGTAISALSGAAAQSAALAWLGGGTIAMHGGGMVAGKALLALAGPIGWSVAGATLLASIALFTNKLIKLDKEKKDEIEKVLKNTAALRKTDAGINDLLILTERIRKNTKDQYLRAMCCYGKNYLDLSDDSQKQLVTLVNNAKALGASLGKEVKV